MRNSLLQFTSPGVLLVGGNIDGFVLVPHGRGSQSALGHTIGLDQQLEAEVINLLKNAMMLKNQIENELRLGRDASSGLVGMVGFSLE